MHKSMLAVFVAAAPWFSGALPARTGQAESAKPAGRPPSSLAAEHGTVDFVHRHRRLVACHARRAPRLTCRAERRAANAGIRLEVVPIRTPGLGGVDKRTPVAFVIASGPSPQERPVALGAGEWNLRRPNDKRPHRFVVKSGDHFKIVLTTLTGACKKVQHECVADLAKTRRRVLIPEAHRAPAAD
jgi:hypothetical protein